MIEVAFVAKSLCCIFKCVPWSCLTYILYDYTLSFYFITFVLLCPYNNREDGVFGSNLYSEFTMLIYGKLVMLITKIFN